MREFNDDEVLDRVESLPTFEGWKKGPYDIWIRSQADAFDQFDDKAFLFWCEADGQRPKFISVRTGTTNTGSYGLYHYDDYNHEGVAILKSDVMVYGSHAKGFHKRNPNNPAYVQVKPWPYYRDANKNKKAEEIGPLHWDIIGANDHRRRGNAPGLIKNWSVACLVTEFEDDYNKFLSFLQSKGYPRLNVVILKEWPKGASKPSASLLHTPAEIHADASQLVDDEPEPEADPGSDSGSQSVPERTFIPVPANKPENGSEGQDPPVEVKQEAGSIQNVVSGPAKTEAGTLAEAASNLPPTDVKEQVKTGFLGKIGAGLLAIFTGQWVIPEWLQNGIDFKMLFMALGQFLFELRFVLFGALALWFIVSKIESIWIRGRVIANNADPTKGQVNPIAHVSWWTKLRSKVGI